VPQERLELPTPSLRMRRRAFLGFPRVAGCYPIPLVSGWFYRRACSGIAAGFVSRGPPVTTRVTTMATVKLTKRTVDAAEPRTARYELWDSELRGLGLRVQPSGLKTFFVRYRAGAGGRGAAKEFFPIGRYGEHLTPDEARRRAREVLGAVARGDNPAEARRKERQADTVAQVAEAFMAEHVRTKRKATTAAHYQHVLNAHVLPDIGKRRAAEITLPDIARIHHRLREKPSIANYVVAVVGSMFTWAAKHHRVPEGSNPAVGVGRYEEKHRQRYLSGNELQAIGAALRLAETDGIPWTPDPAKKTKHAPKRLEARRVRIDASAAAALRLLIFTGARLREILRLRWEEVDFERGLLLLPDSKTGRKTIILNAPALAILEGLPRLGTYVIAGERAGGKDEKPRADLKRPWATVAKAAGVTGVRVHDLRHTHASVGAGSGLGLPIIGKLLGHSQPATTARYAHVDADPLRRASERIGAVISAAMEASPSEVIPLRRGSA
jgi:integrase